MSSVFNRHDTRVRIEFYGELREVSFEDGTNHAPLVWNCNVHHCCISIVDKDSMGQRYACVQNCPEKVLESLTDQILGRCGSVRELRIPPTLQVCSRNLYNLHYFDAFLSILGQGLFPYCVWNVPKELHTDSRNRRLLSIHL